jgi:hypothetical protein
MTTDLSNKKTLLNGACVEEVVCSIEEFLSKTFERPDKYIENYVHTREINVLLRNVMEEVCQLSVQYPTLGSLLFERWNSFNNLDTVRTIIKDMTEYAGSYADRWPLIGQFFVSVMYLKLSVMANNDNARYIYSELLSFDRMNVRGLDSQVRRHELIQIYNNFYGDDHGGTSYHNFVVLGVKLIIKSFCLHYPNSFETRRYRLYVELESAVQDDIIPAGGFINIGDSSITQSEMIEFLMNRIATGF